MTTIDFDDFLKVDILNVMGLAMVGVAWIWSLVPGRQWRIWGYAIATAHARYCTVPWFATLRHRWRQRQHKAMAA